MNHFSIAKKSIKDRCGRWHVTNYTAPRFKRTVAGTLRRKVTRWMNFTSLDALEDAILTFIDYYNTTLAHPYNWTYTGKVLAA